MKHILFLLCTIFASSFLEAMQSLDENDVRKINEALVKAKVCLKGPSFIGAVDSKGRDVLEIFVRERNEEIVKLLLRYHIGDVEKAFLSRTFFEDYKLYIISFFCRDVSKTNDAIDKLLEHELKTQPQYWNWRCMASGELYRYCKCDFCSMPPQGRWVITLDLSSHTEPALNQ